MIAIIVTIVVIVLILYLFPIIQICGNSMYPTLLERDICIGRRVFNKTKCKVGEIYVFRPPYESEEERFIVKRLTAVYKNNRYYFEGDNPDESFDSRDYGSVLSSSVVAQVIVYRKRCK